MICALQLIKLCSTQNILLKQEIRTEEHENYVKKEMVKIIRKSRWKLADTPSCYLFWEQLTVFYRNEGKKLFA